MKLTDLKTSDELLAQQLAEDPAFRAEWERTALARGVAVTLVRYRADRGLAQKDLARLLGMTQPQVARLERGDTNPNIETLMRLAGSLGLEFTIDVRPSNRTRPRLVTKGAQTAHAVAGGSSAGAELLVAAA